jgi:hypothetical protein
MRISITALVQGAKDNLNAMISDMRALLARPYIRSIFESFCHAAESKVKFQAKTRTSRDIHPWWECSKWPVRGSNRKKNTVQCGGNDAYRFAAREKR